MLVGYVCVDVNIIVYNILMLQNMSYNIVITCNYLLDRYPISYYTQIVFLITESYYKYCILYTYYNIVCSRKLLIIFPPNYIKAYNIILTVTRECEMI